MTVSLEVITCKVDVLFALAIVSGVANAAANGVMVLVSEILEKLSTNIVGTSELLFVAKTKFFLNNGVDLGLFFFRSDPNFIGEVHLGKGVFVKGHRRRVSHVSRVCWWNKEE